MDSANPSTPPAIDAGAFRARLGASADEALDAIAELAAEWGGSWQREGTGGRLGLPAKAGLRLGWVEGPVTATEYAADDGVGCELLLRIDHEVWRVDRASVMFLCLALFGVLVTLVAPFVPRLWPLVPMGVLLGIGAWLFIVARLRNSGPEEFMELLSDDE